MNRVFLKSASRYALSQTNRADFTVDQNQAAIALRTGPVMAGQSAPSVSNPPRQQLLNPIDGMIVRVAHVYLIPTSDAVMGDRRDTVITPTSELCPTEHQSLRDIIVLAGHNFQ